MCLSSKSGANYLRSLFVIRHSSFSVDACLQIETVVARCLLFPITDGPAMNTLIIIIAINIREDSPGG
jgi:hypothetical protein